LDRHFLSLHGAHPGSNSEVTTGILFTCFNAQSHAFPKEGGTMKTRTIFLTLVLCLSGVIASFAAESNLGTWKLNEAKSKIPAGVGKNTSVVYTAEGDSYKAVVDGVDSAGKPIHNEWTGKFDGQDYPVTGDPNADTRSIKKIDEHHYDLSNKKDGKPVLTGTIVTSPDGKSRTLTTNTTDAKGKKVVSKFVYDKQ
jgi:hypothetical protein